MNSNTTQRTATAKPCNAIFHQRLEALADFLDRLDPEKFYFGLTVSEWSQGANCGTVCCAIGWTPQLFPDLVVWRHGTIGPKDSGGSCYAAAKLLFDLSYEDYCELFEPTDSACPLGKDASLDEVVNHIRRFIDNKRNPE